MQAPETVAAIVANRNQREYLLECLARVEQSDYENYEVVVVDDASTDGSPESVSRHFPRAHLVRSGARLGAPGARNLGIRCARDRFECAYYLFLDSDAFVEPGTMRALVSALRADAGLGIAAPKAFRSLAEGRFYSAGELKVNLYSGVISDVGAGEQDAGQYDESRLVGACAGFAMLVRRQVVDLAGGFDEAFYPYGWEDVDFALRAVKQGFRIVYVPNAVVEHRGGTVGRGPVAEYEQAKVRNLFLLMRRHASPGQQTCFLCLLPMRAVAHLARQVCRGDVRTAAAQFRGLWRARRS